MERSSMQYFSRTSALAAALGLTAACVWGSQTPGTGYREAQQTSSGPSHAPTTTEQWLELEQTATSLAQSGTEGILYSGRLISTGYQVTCELRLEPNTCYRAGLAWSYPKTASLSVSHQPGADGQTVNDHLGGARESLQGGQGVLEFCADRAGTSVVSVSALDTHGAMAMNELLEYALVVGKRPESVEQTSARRAEEAAQAQELKTEIDSNVAAAEERKKRRLAERCADCKDELAVCRVRRADAKRNPPPGVSYSNSCESEFKLCSFGGSHIEYQKDPDAWPCGEP